MTVSVYRLSADIKCTYTCDTLSLFVKEIISSSAYQLAVSLLFSALVKALH